jgi:hypothetical protein
MFKTAIEGEIREHDTIEEAIDHVESATYFEVDSEALRHYLSHLGNDETFTLRNDCMITRI